MQKLSLGKDFQLGSNMSDQIFHVSYYAKALLSGDTPVAEIKMLDISDIFRSINHILVRFFHGRDVTFSNFKFGSIL